MEIYTLILLYPYRDVEDEEIWSKTFEVKEDCTLQKLHKYIQEIINFDDDHLFEFYLGKHPKNKTEILSNKTKLNEIFPIPGLKLYYLFDFGDCWLFQIKQLRKIKAEEKNKKYPHLIESMGINPEQYPEDE